jgi:hypothetical protein
VACGRHFVPARLRAPIEKGLFRGAENPRLLSARYQCALYEQDPDWLEEL